jgi:hypothetical protein
MRGIVLLIGVAAALALASPAFATSFGGYVFAANAAADTATVVPGSQPSFYLCGATPDDGSPTLPGLTPAQSATHVMTDGVTDAEMFGAVAVDVGFLDNVVVNGVGSDLLVFESGRPEALSVSVFDAITQSFSPPRTYLPEPTGSLGGCGFQLNAAAIDLADFGVAFDNARALFRIDNLGASGCCDGADLMDVFALNSGAPAPEPVAVPSFTFEANSGADAATVVAGSDPSFFECGLTPELGLPALQGLTVDASATRVVADGSADTEVFGRAVLDVGFSDNAVVNGPGPDLAVFESGRTEGFTVSVFDPLAGAFSAPVYFDPSELGFYDHCGYPVNAALIDLAQFGVQTLGTVSLVRIDNLGAPGGFDGADLADVRAVHSAVLAQIAVKPGSTAPTPINLRSAGTLPVAVLSTSGLDARDVDASPVALGDPETGQRTAPDSSQLVDVNDDGRVDLLLRFSIATLVQNGALTANTTRLVLTAQTEAKLSVLGSAPVRTVPLA